MWIIKVKEQIKWNQNCSNCTITWYWKIGQTGSWAWIRKPLTLNLAIE